MEITHLKTKKVYKNGRISGDDVEAFILHPAYDENNLKNDICLIKLRERSGIIEIDESPCMPESLNQHGSECWIAGLGKTENQDSSSEPRSMTINSFDRDYCINSQHR